MQKLLEVMVALRNPADGCPWDLEQSFSTIAPYTIEEAYEVADAIAREDWQDLRGELGDLLFQIVFHAQLADEANLFDFSDVVSSIVDKLTRRHPHVFGTKEERVKGAVPGSWERLKADERTARSPAAIASAVDDIPLALPALKRAAKMGQRAASVGFDWSRVDGVRAKVSEELEELDEAMAGEERTAIEDELGDLLFSVANLARHLNIDPEAALSRATRKFDGRFRGIEKAAAAEGRQLQELDNDELDALWRAEKRR